MTVDELIADLQEICRVTSGAAMAPVYVEIMDDYVSVGKVELVRTSVCLIPCYDKPS